MFQRHVTPRYGLSRKNVWPDVGDAHSYFLNIPDFLAHFFLFLKTSSLREERSFIDRI
jgi:hypothetical protein